MTAQDALAVSAPIVLIAQIFKPFITGKWALVFVMFLSILGVSLWVYSSGGYERALIWSYFAAWATVLTSAAGIFNIVNKAPELVTDVSGAGGRLVRSFTGTGSGDGGPPTITPKTTSKKKR